ncbi:MAG: hypothetical protein GZ091_05500 [Paludibacter sp.]|nr:hypothetical protein [Paludibacter sp.]
MKFHLSFKTAFFFISSLAIIVHVSAQQPRKQQVDTFGIALRMEHKKHLYPTVDSLTTKELAVFVLSPHVKPNASLRLIERNAKAYIEARILYKNVSAEVITAFRNHNYKQLKLQTDSFSVEISDSFKTKMLYAFRKTVHQKFVDLFPKKIEIYDGTNFNFWIYEDSKTTSINIREDRDSRYYGWQFAKINLQLIDDLKNGMFNESKYDVY